MDSGYVVMHCGRLWALEQPMTPTSAFEKGILLAGGSGTRLYPLTCVVGKQLLPVYDKPLIYYPLSTLMLAGIRRILLVTTPQDRPILQRVLGDGTQLGIALEYAEQPVPGGIAEALLIGADFIGGSNVALILGDNIFYGQGLQDKLRLATSRRVGATVFGHPVQDPGRYGIISFDQAGRAESIVEKPRDPQSSLAVTGLYFYDQEAVSLATQLQPSARGELEITDLNRRYLDAGTLHVETFGRGFTWLDAGTEQSLLQAAIFVEAVQRRQGWRIACIEEVAFRMGYIDAHQLAQLATTMTGSYADYVRGVAGER